MKDQQYLRKVSLFLVENEKALDLSELRITFKTSSMDEQSPNSAVIRVYNLSADTLRKIPGEFHRVVLQAGYADNFGVIFDGDIKQYRIGRENGTDTYLDILAGDGDFGYAYSTINTSLAAGARGKDVLAAAVGAMAPFGITMGKNGLPEEFGGTFPRGKVMYGMNRAVIRLMTKGQDARWSIQNGQINITPLDGYLPGQIVDLNGQTGLIGRPEQTIDGVMAKCLINPKIQIGGLVRIDNKAVNQTVNPNRGEKFILPHDQWASAGLLYANVTADGLYRVYVIEYEGDTRGQPWYSNLTLLAINESTGKTQNSQLGVTNGSQRKGQ
jgi:hypothetical protein